MIYYTADLHFGYETILHRAGRPFTTVEEMDEALIQNWNAVVREEDTVYVLGDIGSHETPIPGAQLSRLNGRKHLIRGNHDTGYEDQQQLLQWFDTVTDLLEIDDGEFHITLCHYPIAYAQNGYMIHGHIHNAKKELYHLLRRLPRVMNAGVDVNGFRPVTLAELVENNQRHYEDPLRGDMDTMPRTRKWDAVFRPLPQRSAER